VVTDIGRGLVFGGSATPHPKGAGVPAFPNFGFPSICAYTLCHRTTKSDVVAHLGRSVSWGLPRLPSQERNSSAPQFWGSPVFMPIPFNTANFCMVTHMWRDVFLGQPRSCICTNASRGLSAIAEFRILRQ